MEGLSEDHPAGFSSESKREKKGGADNFPGICAAPLTVSLW